MFRAEHQLASLVDHSTLVEEFGDLLDKQADGLELGTGHDEVDERVPHP